MRGGSPRRRARGYADMVKRKAVVGFRQTALWGIVQVRVGGPWRRFCTRRQALARAAGFVMKGSSVWTCSDRLKEPFYQYLRQHVGLMGQVTSLATSEHREAVQRPLSSTLRGPNKAQPAFSPLPRPPLARRLHFPGPRRSKTQLLLIWALPAPEAISIPPPHI